MKSELILGPAGTGKTTTLLNIIDQALSEGIPPQKIGCFSFSTKASNELINRAIERFPQYKKKDFIYFRTLHSLAFKELKISKADVMGTKHLEDFGQVMGGYDFKNQYNEHTEKPPIGGGLGDKALSVYALAKCKKKPLEEVWRALDECDISWPDLKDFSEGLDKYKAEHNLMLFSDFMEHPQDQIDIDLLVLDEAQDFTAQQWNYGFRTGGKAENVFMAGDDDQTIFEWAGADLGTLLSLNADRKVLPYSYRLPQTHYDIATRILSRISHRYPKTWSPKNEKGTVTHISSEEEVDLSEGTWLLLARHKWELPRLEAIAIAQGVSYEREHNKSIHRAECKAVLYYERLRKGGAVSSVQTKVMAKFIPNWEPPEITTHQVIWDDCHFPFSRDQTWMDVMTLMGYDLKEYIRAMLRRGESLTGEPRVKISTIHMSKGGEAENVLLIPDMSRRTALHYINNPDPELRVWYVAATRSKKNLFIVQPKTKHFFDGLF